MPSRSSSGRRHCWYKRAAAALSPKRTAFRMDTKLWQTGQVGLRGRRLGGGSGSEMGEQRMLQGEVEASCLG